MPASIPAAGRRTWLRLLVAAVAAVVTALMVASPASAHPVLLFTTPAAETAGATSPPTIVLVFGEPVTAAPQGITVADTAGQKMPLDSPASAKDGHAVTARLPQTLPAGVYTVSWRVTGADGDLVEGRFRFAVGAALDPSTNVDTGSGGPAWPATVLRFVLLAGLTLAAGGMVAGRLIGRARTINPALAAVEGWTGVAAVAGAAAAAALAVKLAAQSSTLDTTAAQIAAVQTAAFAIIVVALAVRKPSTVWGALLVIGLAEAIRAHPNIAWPGWGALLTAVHVGAAAVWAGTLIHVVRAARMWREHPGAVRWLVFAYARLALWLAAAVVLTGLVSALLLVPPPTVFSTTYGRLLLAKIGLVSVALAVALLARRRLTRNPGNARAPLRPARLEAGLLAVVLAVTATLTATPPPADATAGQLPPPAATGLVLPLGGLAGQIGVGVQASQGRLVVRLAAPSRDDYYATTGTTQSFTLSGRLITAGSTAADGLAFKGCGAGCYLAGVAWGSGDNLLTLHASAGGWRGGVMSMIVPWPVGDGASTLTQTVAAMKALPRVVFTETVTSDTSQPEDEPVSLSLPAADFLALQPYGSALAPQVVALPRAAGQTRLALGYPAEARYLLLTIDDAYRIVEEVQVDPKHVIRRHYLYKPAT